ncbi:hypothetical protein POTOM_052160 [Populus tomentosa]|uniref:Uncharacterized protein n=1 Tax=Populus tomentosa TaxID=118781 RepID=A0A8X8C037_POPTO|nr:hypothetical protein POTOM_052160 [Populus tomentosa]
MNIVENLGSKNLVAWGACDHFQGTDELWEKQGSQGSHCCGRSLWYGKTGVNSSALQGDERIVVRGDGTDAAHLTSCLRRKVRHTDIIMSMLPANGHVCVCVYT